MYKKFLILQLCLISLIAVFSDYKIPDLSDSNWTTALFLTPSGILTNFLEKNQTVLWSFYSDVSEGQIVLKSHQVLGILLVYVLMMNSFIFFIRSFSKTQKKSQ